MYVDIVISNIFYLNKHFFFSFFFISWPLSSILYCSAHFSALPMLYTTHSFCVLHPFHILHQLPLGIPGTSLNPLPLTVRRLESRAFDPHFTLTFNLNFLLLHTLPNSLTSLHNFSYESATSAVSSANNSWFISNLPLFSLQLQPFPKHPNIHISNHTIHIYIKQPWRYHTALSQSNI